MATEPVKLSKQYDHRDSKRKMTSYAAGYEGPMRTQAHLEGAKEAGAIGDYNPAPVEGAKVTDAKGVKG